MKKILKGLICLGLGGTLALSGFVGCSEASEHRDSETSPLKLAIGSVDRKFSPLFYTSANDGSIAGLTQVSLMTSDENGDLAYGENYATVALDYKETYDSTADTTTYEILLKNGIKFSDGEDLTAMDVLFNMYVYLDPVYSGSATMYSTKIQGLQAYRQQDSSIADTDSKTNDPTGASEKAENKLEAILEWAKTESDTTYDNSAYIDKIAALYREELESDWNSLTTTWESAYKRSYYFDNIWQVFYYIEGVVKDIPISDTNSDKAFYDRDGDGERDEDYDDTNGNGDIDGNEVYYERYYTEFHNKSGGATSLAEQLTEDMKGKTTEEAQKQQAIDYLVKSNTTSKTGIAYILNYCSTASTFYDYLVSEAKSDWYAEQKVNGELEVSSISGIKVSKVKSGETFNETTLDEEHDKLTIVINGVDPKAKWNFCFAVTPMHYYSDEEHTTAAMADYNAYKADSSTTVLSTTHFGVEFGDTTFFNEVLGESSKTRKPVGAGAYACASHDLNGEKASDGDDFFYNNIAYFVRNENFETLGSGIENAKIKYVTYQVLADDKIVEALTTGTIDYGTPTATATNQAAVNTGNLKQTTYRTGGYGYIGINPKYVPDVEVRQAIMYSFDTSSIITYYGSSLVSLINRPVSLTSWASPENSSNSNYDKSISRYYDMTDDVLGDKNEKEFLRDLILSSEGTKYRYVKNGSVISTSEDGGMIVDSSGNQLKYTFTIAGESTNHPSYKMMQESARLLNEVGLSVTVETDIQALQKLATGDLTVWAAAWQSSIDPDPYQIYSVYSNASSTKNWYKDGIVNAGPGDSQFGYEYELAYDLADLIDKGRSTLVQADRAEYYAECYEIIMKLAVEFPTYQRNDLCVYNSAVIDESTLHLPATYNMGPIDELWKVGYKA